jgi:hypothetical protein
MLSIDWLQISILFHPDVKTFTPSMHYEFIETDKKTINFNKLHEVRYHGQTIAYITSEPRHDWMDKTLMIIKFENSYLYADNLDAKIHCFLTFNKLVFRGYTRLDVAYDFNKFDTGQHPKEFIKHYMAGAFRKTDKCKMAAYGSNKEGFDPEYIKWGKGTSDLSYYLYNKTIELREVKHKDWIVQRWLSAGYDISDVWRLEFRIKSQHKMIVDDFGGESKTLQEFGLELLNARNQKTLFSALYTRYFDFRQRNGDSNVTRMPRIELFKDFRAYGFHIQDRPKSDKHTSRSEKIFIKMMCDYNEEMQRLYPDFFSDHDIKVFEGAIAVKIKQAGLLDWAYTRNFVPPSVFG